VAVHDSGSRKRSDASNDSRKRIIILAIIFTTLLRRVAICHAKPLHNWVIGHHTALLIIGLSTTIWHWLLLPDLSADSTVHNFKARSHVFEVLHVMDLSSLFQG